MQHPAADHPPVPPNGAARAYGTVIRCTESPRALEHRVFALVTAERQAAASPNLIEVNRSIMQGLHPIVHGDA